MKNFYSRKECFPAALFFIILHYAGEGGFYEAKRRKWVSAGKNYLATTNFYYKLKRCIKAPLKFLYFTATKHQAIFLNTFA